MGPGCKPRRGLFALMLRGPAFTPKPLLLAGFGAISRPV